MYASYLAVPAPSLEDGVDDPARPSSSLASAHLSAAADDLLVRSEVSSALADVLSDLETRHDLRRRATHDHTVRDLRAELDRATRELEERRALHAASLHERTEIGDRFVGELFALSKTLADADAVASERDELRRNSTAYERLARDLQRAEETIRTLKRNASLNVNANNHHHQNKEGGVTTVAANGDARPSPVATAEQRPAESAPTTTTTTTTEKAPPTTNTAATAAKPKRKKIPRASIVALKEEVLLEIFSFLDAHEVIQAAQVNKKFYHKVNAMFGNASSMDQEDNVVLVDDEDDYETEEEEDEKEKEEKKEEPTRTTTTTNNVVPTIVALPPKKPAPATAPSQPQNPFSSMLSMIQPKIAKVTSNNNIKDSSASSVASSTSNTSGSNAAANIGSSSSSAPPVATLTASMANSMTTKLTPSELSVIINMTERITNMNARNEDLAARLEGTEAVKEFLISKVRDTEEALARKSSQADTIARKVSSDQEVIAFLDGRVRELEADLDECRTNREAETEDAKKRRVKDGRRIRIVEDMLQFERQQSVDHEKEWRNMKKLLVKEVKHCRAQIATLQAERDTYSQQNERLKRALLTLNGGSGGGG